MIVNFQHLHELFFAERRLMKIFRPNRYALKMLYMSNRSWNNSWVNAAHFSLAKTAHQSWGETFLQWWLALNQHNTKLTNTNQKTHANQLISDKFCSLPVNHPQNTQVLLVGGINELVDTWMLAIFGAPCSDLCQPQMVHLNWVRFENGHKKVKHSWAVVCWIGPGGPMSGNLSSDRSQWRHLWNL